MIVINIKDYRQNNDKKALKAEILSTNEQNIKRKIREIIVG
jgi:hypothetical protein